MLHLKGREMDQRWRLHLLICALRVYFSMNFISRNGEGTNLHFSPPMDHKDIYVKRRNGTHLKCLHMLITAAGIKEGQSTIITEDEF